MWHITPFKNIENALKLLYSQHVLETSSITGQRPTKDAVPKPKLDPTKYRQFLNAIRNKYPDLKPTEITTKVQGVMRKC